MSKIIAFPVERRFTPAERRLIEAILRIPGFKITRLSGFENSSSADERAFYALVRRAFPPSEKPGDR